MPFPDVPRVIYDKNPLETVICQVQFPAVLKINAAPPAAFQDSVRAMYPLFRENPVLDLGGGLPSEIAAMVAKGFPFNSAATGYEFTSADGLWTLTLSRDSLALTARRYERWESFKEHLDAGRRALGEHYAPAFLTRIGLRYRDIIRRSTLGLDGIGWQNLLTPQIAGVLASPNVAEKVIHTFHEVLIRLPDEIGQVRAHHGLVKDAATAEACYLIDCDFFTDQRTELTDATKCLDALNYNARLFFRWCLTDRLHNAMGPRPFHGH